MSDEKKKFIRAIYVPFFPHRGGTRCENKESLLGIHARAKDISSAHYVKEPRCSELLLYHIFVIFSVDTLHTEEVFVKEKEWKTRKVWNKKIILNNKESLVIIPSDSVSYPIWRIFIEQKQKRTYIQAQASSGRKILFGENSEKRKNPQKYSHKTNFFIRNLDASDFLFEEIKGGVWSQFNWGELFKYKKNNKFKSHIEKKIRFLINEFLKSAVKELGKDVLIKKFPV